MGAIVVRPIARTRILIIPLLIFVVVLLPECATSGLDQRSKLYFGHPLSSYDTEIEASLLQKIAKVFSDWDIENPNQRYHSEGVRRWREKTGNPMDYFYEELLPRCCKGGVFLPLRDGSWTAGVYGEAQWFLDHGFPIWKVDAGGLITSVDATDFAKIKSLSIEETRARYRDASGNKIPY